MSGFVDDVLGGSSGLLLGTFTPRLDDKGRLILPAKFRPRLAPGLVMTRGQERCLFLLPMDEFRRMYDQIRQAPVTSKQARDYLRVFLSGASDEIPDKQGRISIPAPLRAYAGLPKIDGELKVGPWLYRIATNLCMDQLRRRKLIRWEPWESFVALFHPKQVARDNPEHDALRQESRELVHRVLQELPPRYRICLVLREYHGLSCEEIGDVIGSSRSAVKSLLFRAREEFRQVYQRMGGTGPL